MASFNLCKSFELVPELTGKVTAVMRMFGLSCDQLKDKAIEHKCDLKIKAGDVVYITGPSGSGKSVLLGELERSIPASDRVNLSDIELPDDKAVIDCVEGDYFQSLRLLNMAGLSDVYCVLNKPANLSDGQKYRFRLTQALASGKKFIFADEFCSDLDRVTAAVISYNVQRFAKKMQVTFVLASSHDDVLLDLEPDVLVLKELSGPVEVIYKTGKCKN